MKKIISILTLIAFLVTTSSLRGAVGAEAISVLAVKAPNHNSHWRSSWVRGTAAGNGVIDPETMEKLYRMREIINEELRNFSVEQLRLYKQPGTAFIPSSMIDAYQALKSLNLSRGSKLLDVGAGDGTVLFVATLLGYEAVGYENNSALIELFEAVKKRLTSEGIGNFDNAEVKLGNVLDADFSEYDVIYNYKGGLSNENEERLKEELALQMREGAYLIVYSEYYRASPKDYYNENLPFVRTLISGPGLKHDPYYTNLYVKQTAVPPELQALAQRALDNLHVWEVATGRVVMVSVTPVTDDDCQSIEDDMSLYAAKIFNSASGIMQVKLTISGRNRPIKGLIKYLSGPDIPDDFNAITGVSKEVFDGEQSLSIEFIDVCELDRYVSQNREFSGIGKSLIAWLVAESVRQNYAGQIQVMANDPAGNTGGAEKFYEAIGMDSVQPASLKWFYFTPERAQQFLRDFIAEAEGEEDFISFAELEEANDDIPPDGNAVFRSFHANNFLTLLKKLQASNWASENGFDIEREILSKGNKALCIGLETGIGDDLSFDALMEDNLVTVLSDLGMDIMGLDPAIPNDYDDPKYISDASHQMPEVADDQFDVVVSIGLFEPGYAAKLIRRLYYLSSKEFYLLTAKNIKRVLKDGGYFILDTFGDKNELFLEILEAEGFQVEEIEKGHYLIINHKSSLPVGTDDANRAP